MSKLIFFALIAVVSAVVVHMRKAEAKKRLAELDDGKRCVACNGTEMEVFRGNARCRRCGHTASLAGLRSAQITDAEIAKITAPDDRHAP
jgi:hypothetical protein